MALQDPRTILLVGATGLVGRACLRLLAADPTFARVVVLTRRPLPPALRESVDVSKLDEHVIDFDRLGSHAELFQVDDVLCTLGTTIRQAGSRDRFRMVDYGYPLTIARLALAQGARHYLLVSSAGASARSPFFYQRVKGMLEDALYMLPFRSVTIVRPSLLVGKRDAFRLGEAIGKRLGFLAPPAYRPVAATAVAAALVQAAREDAPGRRFIESDRIGLFAEAYRRGAPA